VLETFLIKDFSPVEIITKIPTRNKGEAKDINHNGIITG